MNTYGNSTIVALVEDKPGVLNRIASMFRRRGFNIASLAVGHSEDPHLSRMTFVVDSADRTAVDKLIGQLKKIIEVVEVLDLTGQDIVARELCLVKVKAPNSATRGEIVQIVELFRTKIVDVGADSLTIEITGDEDKVESILALLKGFGIVEIMRTGRIAMTRGKKAPLESSTTVNGAQKSEVRARGGSETS